jgi:L,D-peptidoglycan transpeptidase YkuD (ErfK/YbiS/YcfS/YnhG family)
MVKTSCMADRQRAHHRGKWWATAAVVVALAACGSPDATSTTTSATQASGQRQPAAADERAAAATSPTTIAAGPSIGGAAVAGERAGRGIAAEVGATCDLDLVHDLATRHPGVRQFITVSSDAWSATTGRLEVVAFDGSDWVCQLGARPAMLGSNGTRPLLDRRSGDGTTPAGVFPLGTQTAWDGQRFQFFGNSPDPGVRGSYRAVQQQDCWGATPAAATYQQLYARANCPGPDDEWLPRFGDVYSYAAVIGANLTPVSGDAPGEPAYAAAIFLHRNSYGGGSTARPTSGCVSLDAADLVTALRLIDPALDPHFAIGLRSWISTTA